MNSSSLRSCEAGVLASAWYGFPDYYRHMLSGIDFSSRKLFNASSRHRRTHQPLGAGAASSRQAVILSQWRRLGRLAETAHELRPTRLLPRRRLSEACACGLGGCASRNSRKYHILMRETLSTARLSTSPEREGEILFPRLLVASARGRRIVRERGDINK